MASEYLFTSESVSEGHPDKVADQISDAVLDACVEQDPLSRVAAETLCTTGLVVMAGEITTNATVDYIDLARNVLKRIGYDNTEYGIDHKGCAVLVGYDKQSQDIKQGVDKAADDELNLGAGDQGLMFGFACTETPTLMPAPIYYAHQLMQRQALVRKNGTLPFLRPDAKSQVTLRYRDGVPVAADTIVISSQHSPDMSLGTQMKPEFIEAIVEEIIRPVRPAEWLKDTKFLINPTGRFVVGGPPGGGGLACRKTEVIPDLLLGDFDSLSAQPDFPNILRVPVEKDDTDTMLAVKTGLERGETEFHIYGGMGGRRTDHTVANFQALLYLARRGARGWLYGQGERYTAISGDSITFPARDRGILSVFCLGADAQDVSILGGQYPLHHAVLTADFPLGVSNHFAGQPITVSVRDGSLLIGVVDE